MCGPVPANEEREIYVVFRAPKEHPNGFAVRRYRLRTYGVVADGSPTFSESLEAARDAIPPGMHYGNRKETDPASIVELWS